MLDRNKTLGLATVAALTLAGMVRAETPETAQQPTGASQLVLGNAAYLDDAAPPPPPKPLMGALEGLGVGKTLENANINLYGFVEGGYTYSANPPPTGRITGNVFNTKQNRIVLDQADFIVEKTVDAAAAAKAGKVDFGFRADFIYGWDSGPIHSNGLYDNDLTTSPSSSGAPGTPYYRSRNSPENQFDVNQAYVDVALPLGNGLRVRVGKFVTLLGQETINPTGNALYSHSYLFGYAIPFTQTGVLATYTLNDKFTIDAGITRGWNQSINDNNGSPDFLGRVTYTLDANTSVLLSVSEGPEAIGDVSDYWTVLDLIVTHKFGDALSMAVNADYGDAPHDLGSRSAQWYGIAAYASLILDPHFTVNVRGEAYHDEGGATLGLTDTVYEATLGVAITPLPNDNIGKNLVLRPEVRYDYSDKNYYNGVSRHDQFQVAMDVIFNF